MRRMRSGLEVHECECGCDGACGSAAESVYQLEPAQIDQLIEWAGAYNKRRWEEETTSEENEEFLVFISALDDMWRGGAMTEKQRLLFEESFGLSGCMRECVCDGGCDGCLSG
jgi:hypothetical protein